MAIYSNDNPDERGFWTQTAEGDRFYPLDPRPEDFVGKADEIAEHLSKKCRFAGATVGFYSVAEHCVHVSRWAETKFMLAEERNLAAWHGLFHDAAEAYLVDVPRPIKYGIESMAAYREVEHRVTAAIYEAFSIDLVVDVEARVEAADKEVLAAECDVLMINPSWSQLPGYTPASITIDHLEWWEARSLWLQRYRQLEARRGVH